MKFCKNLQKVADLSNPEWYPYWTDYKKLKKIIKRLSENMEDGDSPTPDQHASLSNPVVQRDSLSAHSDPARVEETQQCYSSSGVSRRDEYSRAAGRQGQGDRTSEKPCKENLSSDDSQRQDSSHSQRHRNIDTIRRNPGEVLFFKLLHGEFHKAVHFFDSVIGEFEIREERVAEGVGIARKENRFQLWNTLAKGVYRFYTDLLLLETFCIMTYCSFSKILKKHDKVTGFDTRGAFMCNVVEKANFTSYEKLQEMISRCEKMFSEVTNRLIEEQQQDLYEDERLFIEMVHRLNQQVR